MSLHYSKVISYLVFIELLFFVSTSGHLQCDPRTNCAKAVKGNKVPNPNDCFSYYICIEDEFGNIVPSDNSVPCQSGYYFNANTKSCYSGLECRYPCPVLCNPHCSYYANERIADIDDCSTFYTCKPNGKIEKDSCPKTAPYFDGVVCSTKNYSCCTQEEKCSPYCDDYYREIADPYDCHGFYICSSATGTPKETDRHQCQEGQYFDANLGRCQTEFSPCSSLCSK